MFLGKTDWAYADAWPPTRARAASSARRRSSRPRPKLPGRRWCPAAASSVTGRSSSPTSSPWPECTRWSRFPEKHFLRPSEFTPGSARRRLGAALDFVRPRRSLLPAHGRTSRSAATTCCRRGPAWCTRISRSSAARPCRGRSSCTGSGRPRGRRSTGVSYWRGARRRGIELGERYVHGGGGAHWLVPFAPTGGREVDRRGPGRGARWRTRDGAGGALRSRPVHGARAVRGRRPLGLQLHLFGGPLAARRASRSCSA